MTAEEYYHFIPSLAPDARYAPEMIACASAICASLDALISAIKAQTKAQQWTCEVQSEKLTDIEAAIINGSP